MQHKSGTSDHPYSGNGVNMGGSRRKKRNEIKLSPWWGLLVLAIAAVVWAAVDDFLKLNPEKPIPASSTSQ